MLSKLGESEDSAAFGVLSMPAELMDFYKTAVQKTKNEI